MSIVPFFKKTIAAQLVPNMKINNIIIEHKIIILQFTVLKFLKYFHLLHLMIIILVIPHINLGGSFIQYERVDEDKMKKFNEI